LVFDSLPPEDAGRDGTDETDAFVTPELQCDGGLPIAYLFDKTGSLYTFNPQTLETTALGTPECDSSGDPWTLSASNEGKAYVVYQDWYLYEVDISTLECSRTPFAPGQLGITSNFAIAVSRNPQSESLLYFGRPPSGEPLLARSNLADFILTEVGQPRPSPPSSAYPYDMQADLMGHVYVLTPDGFLLQVNVSSASVTSQDSTGYPGAYVGSWAVMTYQDDVYLFGGQSVARFDRALKAVVPIGTVTTRGAIVGASAVPCFGVEGG
jgi:hypothetical protein